VVGLPAGTVAGPWPSADRSRFLVTADSPVDAMNVWVVDPATAEAVRWTATTLGTVPPEALVQPELVHFESFDGLPVPAFYYRPAEANGPLPVVINIHGGPEGQAQPIFNPVTQYLVGQGYAVLAPNVRGSTGYGKTYGHLDDVRKRMDSVADIKAAHAWLVEHGGADPGRIAVMGGSYGGFMVLACLVTYPQLWAAGVDIVGIANFVTFLENTSAYRRKVREHEYGSLENDRDFLAEISPINQVERITAPLLVIHGANDPRVPLGESDQIVESLRRREVPVEYLVYGDEGHGLAKLRNRLDAYPKVAAFLDRHMRTERYEG
jgi:dipeptidyl aminopeptidase/acylaminoacyl peptidase